MAGKGRTVLKGLLVVLGLLVVTIVAAILLVPKDALRDMALARIEQETGRPVSVGAASVRLLPPGLTLRDLEIGEPAVGPRSRVTVRGVTLQARLWPLLQRRLVVTHVLIEEPLVEVFMDQPGSGAAALQTAGAGAALPAGVAAKADAALPAGVAAGAAQPGGPSPAAPSPASIQVRELQIHGGRVLVHSPGGEPFIVLAGLSEQLAAEVSRAGLVQLSGETTVDTVNVYLPTGMLGRDIALRLRKTLSYDTTRDLLSITEATLTLGDLPVAVTGQITGLATQAPAADLHMSGGPAGVASILGYLPDAMLPTMAGLRSGGTLSVAGAVRGPLTPPPGTDPLSPEALPDFAFDLKLAQGHVQHPRLPAPLDDIALELHANRDTIEVAEFSARTGSSRLQARATVTEYLAVPQVVLGLDADADLADVSALQANQDSLRLSGRATAQLVVSGPAQPPEALVPVGTIRLTNAGAQGLLLPVPVSSANGTITLRGKDLLLDNLAAQVGRSDVRVNGKVSDFRALDPRAQGDQVARIEGQVRSRVLDLDEFIPPPGQRAAQRALAAGKGTGAPPATSPAGMLALIKGSLGVQVDEIKVNRAILRNARGTVGIDRGLFNLEGVTAESFGGRLAAVGSLDYRQPEKPSFDMRMQIQEAQVSQLYSYAAGLNRFARLGGFLTGAINATAKLSGNLNDTLGLDLGTFNSIGNLQMRSGSIANHPLQTSLVEYLNAPQLAKLGITDWLQPFSIQNGRLVVDGMSLKAGPIEVGATGWQAIDGTVSMSLDLILPQELAAGIRSQVPAELAPVLFGGAGERLALPLEVSGSYPKPKIGLNLEKLRSGAQQRVEQRLAQERERLQQEALKQANQFLKGLVDAPADTTKKEMEQRGQQVEKEVRDLLKGILKKKK